MSPVFDSLRTSAVSMDIMAVSRGTPQDVARRQQARLAQLLDFTQRHSRFYQALWPAGTNAQTPLQALPPVTRQQLMEHFNDWVTDPALEFEALRSFVADPTRIAEPYLGRYVVWESSGTSGQPGIFVQDAQVMAVYDGLQALRRSPPPRALNWFDPLGLSERTAFVGALGGHFASYVSLKRLCALNPWLAAATRSFSIMEPIDSLVGALNRYAPTSLATYATAGVLLADEVERGHLHLHPREIWLAGECLSPHMRSHITEQLRGGVRNSYGASEFLPIAWECSHGKLHVNADWVILEPVDEQYRPVPCGQLSHSVLVTSLANSVQPLIRYDLGDQITMHAPRCGCGSPLPVIEVRGRQDEPLVMVGDNGQNITLLPMALSTVIEDDAGVFDFYLRQVEDNTLVLRIPLGGEEGKAAMARCRAALKAYAASQGIGRLSVRAELGQAVPRGRSGKAHRIVAHRGGGQCAP